ncbi:5-oxoprolinase, putative [Talaromyces stipitatus ATCC 10500]|uniref:5-oxoprolinase, putative n=1 Tax=Talaromyces stipitatus (strain ATCC 10500 / CBS 375.48 / QM 6759 / NRRL 1006) TaxID=441959 RepID=B8MFM4_TALSN|nr:5-oxoprolinase, putative [Talaromyces stipitatus ATCC 10500]EED17014.1 5-oxoprolinase, putative [Talaromyces stipitatus ATCC 10500]
MTSEPHINISIDRGGTFCDVLVQARGREDLVFKLLSEDPQNYPDAPAEAIRRALEILESREIPIGEKIDGSSIEICRIGTTIATNALLEGKGRGFAFIATKGFRDICVIGDQTRPHLFALNVRKPVALHQKVVEIDERVTIEDYDLNPFPIDKTAEITDPNLIRTASGEIVRIIKPLNVEEARKVLEDLKNEGYTSVAISFMHSFLYPDHENQVAQIARDLGFQYVTTSNETSPTIKYEQRSASVCSETYLFPIVKDYIASFQSSFSILPKRVEFMSSDGGMRQANKFRGNEALLSGPAGGVVGVAQTCFDTEEGMPLLGFDMGGTSTDVCRYDGKYDYLTETVVAGRKIINPMLNIATVAAGGGSMLFARHGMFVVGPESAGAHPGPACYRKGGPLTVTDANLFLGRLVLSSFPAIFGPNANMPLDYEITAQKFQEITREINKQASQNLTPEEVALGFLNVGNETMSRPMRNATEVRGFAPSVHALVSFGGAGGQHACAIADKLGIKRILIHKYSSILSAVGIAQAELQTEATSPFTGNFSMKIISDIEQHIHKLKSKVRDDLVAQGADSNTVVFEESLSMRYGGTDTNLIISKPADNDYGRAFIEEHLREYAFNLSREISVNSIKVRGVGRSNAPTASTSPYKDLSLLKGQRDFITSSTKQPVFIGSQWQDVPIFNLATTAKKSKIHGPALIIDTTQTIFVEPQYDAYILPNHVILERTNERNAQSQDLDSNTINPIDLSIFSNRFMAIAEQMGHTLQRTSISTSIKERLDFSCAIFTAEGKLVANAPHIPIHLGSMQYAIQYQHRLWKEKLKPGDVLLSNHPECGGTHLPDITVITPAFIDGQIAFYVAARGHHTDIGGVGITSMMPGSTQLWQEGFNVLSLQIVDNGRFLEEDVRKAFLAAGDFPGCSPTRRLDDNISDIKAQISSNQRGIILLQKLCQEFSLPVVHRYMHGIQSSSEMAIKEYLRGVAQTRQLPLTASDHFDDGTILKVSIDIDDSGSAVFDWEGTGPQMWGNYNCPISITYSAVIYTLRCLIDKEIPLNDGCLSPITIKIPKGSVLRPSSAVAICGSTLASQRVIDTILKAFGEVAAFSGCANSFGWGMGGKNPITGAIEPGWNYGETVGGGCGAGPGWHGEHATQAHSTNTKITDPEVVEKRTPVIVRRHEINYGSGGKGKFNGGNGATREIEARVPLKFSILSDRRVYAPYGLNGGEPGSVGKNFVFKWNEDRSGHEKLAVGGKTALSLKAGEIMQINSPGGGGWGAPDS